jgi:hypothetical protein
MGALRSVGLAKRMHRTAARPFRSMLWRYSVFLSALHRPPWRWQVRRGVRHHSDALVKMTLSFFAVVLLISACKRQDPSTDDKMQKMLQGTWTSEARFANGGDTVSTSTIAADGSYVCTIDIPGRTNGPRTVRIEGTF